jgi:enamine deaminase RidA (YjgF/YER057c/UK114 family)
MTKRLIEKGNGYKIYLTMLGGNQAFITASVTEQLPAAELSARIYRHLLTLIQNHHLEILHERIFADLNDEAVIKAARKKAFAEFHLDGDMPLTFIQGRPVQGKGLAGVQIRAFAPTLKDDGVWLIHHQDEAVGRRWRRNGNDFYMLQNIFGDPAIPDRYLQSCDMYDRAQEILLNQDLSFKNVLRTWIYLSAILDWYGEFNRARNTRFTEFGLLGLSEKENTEAEYIYLPASTGILGENPLAAAAAMDIFAVSPAARLKIAHTSGVQQKSPYRYGSAFSRAMTMKEDDVTHILLSGTASIDEHGKTVYLDDPVGQIRKTVEVVQALILHEGASLQDIHEATVFFKDAEDMQKYWPIAEQFGITDLPAVFIIADVCRDDLLFEIDAAIALS